LIGLRDGTAGIPVLQFEVVREQFVQIIAVIVIVFMNIVQKKDEPFPVINPVCLAATKHRPFMDQFNIRVGFKNQA